MLKGSDLIEAAIVEAMTELEGHKDGDVLVDWIVVAFADNPDEEEGVAYPMFYSNGNMAKYKARGLLVTGLTELTAGLS